MKSNPTDGGRNGPSFVLLNCEAVKTGIFGQPELFDPKLMYLNFDPGVKN
jgi:hypothetical protein